ncbi:MAG: sialate O-acetylesterase [Opitutaceae bacterium]|jgi:sialate O-acetylesterase
MKTSRVSRSLALASLLLSLAVPAAWGEVSLPPLFSSHAVLQKAPRVPVWGKASAGERITVTLGTASASATAGADGKWSASLDLAQSGPGPFDLVVKGTNTLTVSDVVVGEVWLASGQSNMEWVAYNTTGAKEEMAQSANPQVRQFLVRKNTSPTPLDDMQGEWKVAGPSTTGGFTATGYFFAKSVQQALGRPVGLLNSSWGGTNVEGWTSADGVARLPALKESTAKYGAEEQSFPVRIKEFATVFSDWTAKTGREDKKALSSTDVLGAASTVAWQPVTLPATAGAGLPANGGVVWLRRTVNVPAGSAGLQQSLDVGRIDGFFTIYFNGEKVSEVTPATGLPRPGAFYVKGDLIKAGDNTLALRIYHPAAMPAVVDGQPFRFIYRPISGEWQAHVEQEFPALAADARSTLPPTPVRPMNRQDIGGYLYNGMIHPMIPYGIRGVIWYQGESNGWRAAQYREFFPNLITDWRARWGMSDLPFYFCQLANFGGKSSEFKENSTAELREAQSLALKLPNTGQAVLIDVGEADDIHPRNKRDVGARLARIALANTYGRKDITFSGPVYQAQRIEGERIRIAFTQANGGLVAKELPATYAPRSTVDRTLPLEKYSAGSDLQGFAICGADRKWVWAQAKIDGDKVVVWSSAVKSPIAVRYGWASNPTCNLYNGAGLPASPFRTDDFPLSTLANKY